MDLAARHIGFVLASYGVAFALLAALIVWLVVRMRRVRRRLAALEAQGARRRRKTATAGRHHDADMNTAGAAMVDDRQEASSS